MKTHNPNGHGGVLSFCAATLAIAAFGGNAWYVDCASGDDANSGAFGSPKATICAAMANAASGDIVYVAPGTYGAAEGAQAATSKVAARVVVPAGVTLESTHGAEKTFIVGAEATGEGIDNETYKTGANAVRCVYANSGATVRGFTLTGGHTVGTGDDSGNGFGSAFYSATERGAFVEDCIVSNNAAYRGTINQAVVRRCRIFDNTGINNAQSGAAGYKCSFYGSVIDRNGGGGTVSYSAEIVNCTFGASNRTLNNVANFRVVYGGSTIVNSAILGGGVQAGKSLCLTNCVVVYSWTWGGDDGPSAERRHNTVYTNAAAASVDAAYRPVLGSFVGIDAGDGSRVSASMGARDVYGTPRVLNGVIDMGAVEYDWRPTFAAAIGRRIVLADVSPSVTTNAAGGLRILSGAVSGTVPEGGKYSFAFDISGGTVEAFVGGTGVGTCAVDGRHSIVLNIPDAETEFRFAFAPDAEGIGSAVLVKVASNRGLVITYR